MEDGVYLASRPYRQHRAGCDVKQPLREASEEGTLVGAHAARSADDYVGVEFGSGRGDGVGSFAMAGADDEIDVDTVRLEVLDLAADLEPEVVRVSECRPAAGTPVEALVAMDGDKAPAREAGKAERFFERCICSV
jgi:hypothetical protein